MDYKVFEVSLERIDFSDDFFRISTNIDTRALYESIREAGLIHPPILQEKGEGAFRIVSGFGRVDALARTGVALIPARLAGKNAPVQDLALMAVLENTTQRDLDVMEKARAVRLLIGSASVRDRFDLLKKALGQKAGLSHLEKLVRLCDLPGPIQDGISKGQIPFAIAQNLTHLEDADVMAFGEIFLNLSLSLNKQREIITLSTEIAKRDSLSIKQTLLAAQAMIPGTESEPDKNQEAKNIRAALKSMRYPEITKASRAFLKQMEKLDLPHWMKLLAPAHFEGDWFELSIRFKTRENLVKACSEMDRLANDPLWDKLLKKP